MTLPRPLLLALLLPLAACQPPPEAPEDLDELCSFLFEHHSDEDLAYMQAGVDNLVIWLDEHIAEAEDGYSVTGISEESVSDLGGRAHSVQDIYGVSLPTVGEHSVLDMVEGLTTLDFVTVDPDYYEDFERTYHSDIDCFVDRSCDRLATHELQDISLPFNIHSLNQAEHEYLWLNDGAAMVQRSWLDEPPETNSSWLEVDDQYYLNAILPREGGHYRVQTTWLVNSQDDVPRDTVMALVVRGLRDNAAALETFLAEQ